VLTATVAGLGADTSRQQAVREGPPGLLTYRAQSALLSGCVNYGDPWGLRPGSRPAPTSRAFVPPWRENDSRVHLSDQTRGDGGTLGAPQPGRLGQHGHCPARVTGWQPCS